MNAIDRVKKSRGINELAEQIEPLAQSMATLADEARQVMSQTQQASEAQAAEPLTAHARRRKRPHAGVKSGSPCSRIKSVFFHQNFLEANCTFHV